MFETLLMKRPVFFPFPYRTREDRVRLLASLWFFRLQDLPVPVNAGYMLVGCDDKELHNFFKDVVACSSKKRGQDNREWLTTCINALEVIGYFHGLKCKNESPEQKCLGGKVSDKINELAVRMLRG